jgi:hypothetical protein
MEYFRDAVIGYFIPVVRDVCVSCDFALELLVVVVVGGLVMVEGGVTLVVCGLGGRLCPFDTCGLEAGGEASCS